MEITEVRLTLRCEERLKAFVSITFDDAFVVRGLKVIEGNAGLFVAMPSRRRKDGEFRDIAHPINNETRQMIEDAVFSEYRRQLEVVERGGGLARVLAEGQLVHAEDPYD
ncbi:MAG: septation regulator SpoVG [Candidatus Eisenbacteria bacterium]|nr:septation regulator SpoVG [Candidatus Eisenbacteria bacterium]